MKVNLSPYESRVLWFIFRKTYGWKKKSDWITLKQFTLSTGLDRRLAHRAAHSLFDRNIIVINRNENGHVTYSFQKNYMTWKASSPKRTVIRIDDKTSSAEMMRSTKENSTRKNITKDTIQKKPDIPYQEIINYLNRKTGKRFTLRQKASISHINARWNEGHTLADFKTVIDNKSLSWLNDSKMARYLRPETLFNTKFESYLNETPHPLAGSVSDTTIRNITLMQEWRPSA